MENTDHSLYISKLIIKSFQGELSEKEKQELTDWLTQPKHRHLYDSLRNRDLTNKKQQIQFLNQDKSWKKLEQQIPFVTQFRTLRILRYAALFLLPLLVGGILYFSLFPHPQSGLLVSQQNLPVPGYAQATLILETGEKIPLNDNKNFCINQDSAIVLNNDQGILKINISGNTTETTENYQILSIPKGGEYKLILSDGSKIWLNSDSRLRFPTSFTGNQRLVYLEGEAYFEVAHHVSKPFIVNSRGMNVEVLGTKFNIKAYAEDQAIYTTLAEGAVKTTLIASGESLLLQPDQQCIYNAVTGQLSKQDVDAHLFTDWTTGKFVFENETLEEIMKQLNRWYDTETSYQSPEIRKYRFTGDVDRFDHISTLLEMIEQTYNIKFQVQGRTIVVGKK